MCENLNFFAVPFETQSSRPQRISPLAAWIVFCVFCNCVGWILSALHELNATGYAAAFGLGILALAIWKAKTKAVFFQPQDLPKLRRRFTRPFPLAFLILAALATLGGLIYAPTNYDALAYRLPRVLHWLAEGQWHWIHTDFSRVNTRGCGIEWVSAAIIAFIKTDRPLFLLNVISFLLLPGLMFSILTRFGVRPRVAWYWMWPLACASCFLLQAGSIANDLFVVPFVLAAVDYALRAHQRRSVADLCLSILAAGLFTGVKANTIPLGLPYIIVLAPNWKLALKRPLSIAMAGVIALMVSFVPTAIFNIHYSGDWTGGVARGLPGNNSKMHVWARLAGNSAILAISGLTPPVDPFAEWWNDHVANYIGKQPFGKAIDSNFETDSTIFSMAEMENEEGAGLGFGVCLLVAATVAAVFCSSRNRLHLSAFRPLTVLFVLGTCIALLVFMITSDVMSTCRLLAPYYPFLLVPVLIVVPSALVRRRWWKGLALATFVLAALPVICSPARPLFPWKSSIAMLQKMGCPEHLLQRAQTVYSVYSHRSDGFAPILPSIPKETRVVGLVTYDDPEATLWLPFGARRVIHVCRDDTADILRTEGLTYILVSSDKFHLDFPLPFDQWLARMNGTVVDTVPLTLRAGQGPVDWYVVKLN